ncbi:MAG: hypothetical protein KAS71_16705, partial [Bacteroidales bacterium]|nr:hypothetical protein [Bacteroidales bacterium]
LELIELNKQRVEQYQSYYKRRQAIVEHPYGTIKRQWGFNYIIKKKSIERASADVGFMITAYNLSRIINIIGKRQLRELSRLSFAINRIFRQISTHRLNLGYSYSVLKIS